MQGSQYDIEMTQGSTWELQLTVRNSAGTIVDISLYSFEMQIRTTYAATTATETLSSTSGEMVITGALGKVNITLAAERTAAIKVDLTAKRPPKSMYVYDLEMTDDTGKKQKLLYGDVTVYGEVTR